MKGLPIEDPRPELQMAADAAVEAGKAVMEVYAGGFSEYTKADDSPVTEADIRSNRIINGILGERSGHWILSEEEEDDVGARLKQDLVWIIDPLDGTTDFVKRTGEFTIMIALVEGKVPVIGVILRPTDGTLYIAQKDSGAYRLSGGSWQRLCVTKKSELQNCRAVCSRNHMSHADRALFEELDIGGFASIGSSLKVGMISSGEAELYVTTTDKMKEWDSCASFCILSEAGGKMTDTHGNGLTYNNGTVRHLHGIVASNGLIHDKVIEKIGSQNRFLDLR